VIGIADLPGVKVDRVSTATGLGLEGRHCKRCKVDTRGVALYQVTIQAAFTRSFVCEACIRNVVGGRAMFAGERKEKPVHRFSSGPGSLADCVVSEPDVSDEDGSPHHGWGERSDYLSAAARGLRGSVRVAPVDKQLEPDKVYCDVCKFWVTAEGHEDKCVPRHGGKGAPLFHENWNARRKRAWVHDALLMTDVRMVGLMRGVPGPQLAAFQRRYTDNEALAAWYDKIEDKSCMLVPVSGTEHAKASVIEAMYEGAFRDKYLMDNFGEDGQRVVRDLQFSGGY